jgi:acetyl esterase/lipase
MRTVLRRAVVAGVAAALGLTAVLPSYATHDKGKGKSRDKHSQGPKRQAAPQPPPDPCTGNPFAVQQMSLQVEQQEALALVALPRNKPRGIVVFDHGYGHTMESWRAHAARTADTLGVIAIAPNYRGQKPGEPRKDGLPSSRGWRVAEGAADSIAFAQHFDRLCTPTGTSVIYGVSMGGNTSGLVVAAKPKSRDGSPLFDYWVDVEGAVNVSETYASAAALAPGSASAAAAKADIEEAFGGTPAQAPNTYSQRTVVNRTADIAAAGLQGVYVVHGVGDGLVPYNQSRELQALLRARGVPVDMWSAVTRKKESEPGTTADGYLPTGQTSPFAGHASETSTALNRIYAGEPFRCGETVYDGSTDNTVRTSSTGC